MSGLIGLLFYVFLLWFIIKVAKKKKQQTAQTRPSAGNPSDIQNNAQLKPAQASRTKRRQAHVQSPVPVSDAPEPHDYFGEGEDPRAHEAHLMHSGIEGESEEEHAAHMKAADAHTSAKPARSGSMKADPASLRRAVVMSEVLGKPVAYRAPYFSGRR